MIEKALHVSTSTAVLVLKKMLQLGLLKKYGEGRNVSYSLAC
jgi:predicted transcriptional regulator